MARIRSIKPSFFRHEALFELERDTGLPIRVAFAGLWTAADREGRFVWRPRQLKLDCLPYDEVDFSRVLDALATRGFIQKYTVAGVDYGCIPSWNQHQVINNRESASEIPAFSETPAIPTPPTRDARVDDASATPLVQVQGEGKGREGEREGNGEQHAPAEAVASALANLFLFALCPETKPAKQPNANRLPKDWTLPTDWIQTATEIGLPVGAVQTEAAKFRDYWCAKSGKDATKLDWLATWRNWCRNAVERTYAGRPNKHDLSRMNYTAGVTADGKF